MNKKLQRLGIFLVLCYLAVFLKLHQTQLLDVQALAERPDNTRPVQRKLNRPRGMIVTADGVVLARSDDVGGPMQPRQRVYPEGALFGHITGFFSRLFGTTGVEDRYDDRLSGDTIRQQVDGLANLFAGRENVGHVQLSLRKDLQQLARDQLGDREGAVTVLDPRTGAVLAMWSNPSFDPTPLVTATTQAQVDKANDVWALLNMAAGNPMRSKAFRERYNPGSTFKPVTAATGLMTGAVTWDRPVYPQKSFLTFPDFTGQISNFQGGVCGGTLPQITTTSCNTSFMQMGLDVGLPALADEAKKFGWLQDVPLDLPGGVQSELPTDPNETGQAGLAQTAIGQQHNAATPLQMAMVAAAVANNGVLMRPHVMLDVQNLDATVVETFRPTPWLTPMTPDRAQVLREAMLGPVNNPNGTAFGRIKVAAGMVAGGKTGTAQTGGPGAPLHTWFVGFAGPQGKPPTVAVSVVVLRQPNRGEATGGQVAGPIANAVMNKALEVVDMQPSDTSGIIAPPTTAGPRPGPFGSTTTTR